VYDRGKRMTEKGGKGERWEVMEKGVKGERMRGDKRETEKGTPLININAPSTFI